jgi:hypothetical protein
LPGSKVIQALTGLETLDDDYDVLMKADADLIFLLIILKLLPSIFNPTHDRYGRWFCYIEKNGDWVLENLTDKDHIRGALKASKSNFQQIGD